MEFENSTFGKCELLNCDSKLGKALVFIKNNMTNPYVVTSKLLKDNNWVKGEHFATYEEAKEHYEKM